MTGGQGSSHVRALHAEGANVVIGGLDADRGTALADELGDSTRFARLDVRNEGSWAAAVEAAESTFGALNVLVNNAGVQNPPALIEDTDQATWSRILDVNVSGTFLGIKVAAPALRRAAGGAVVNIASTMALGGTARYAPYVASKWAVRGFTRTAALELGRDNIPVNSIHPGVIATPPHPRTSSRRHRRDRRLLLTRAVRRPPARRAERCHPASPVPHVVGGVVHHRRGVRHRRWALPRPRPSGRDRMGTSDTIRSDGSAPDASLSHLPQAIRRFFYRAAGAT
ncbi:SDR family oxidoreductase [Isoptericola halotolerans]